MVLKSKSLKHLAMAGIFGAFLLIGLSTAANAQGYDPYYNQQNNDYYNQQNNGYYNQNRQADSHHRKDEKRELKHHQRDERDNYGNSRDLKRHQQQEKRQIKNHQRNERRNDYDPYYDNRRY